MRSSRRSTPGKFAYICHFQQIGINATVFEKREFILKVTFSLPLPSSMLKLPTDWANPAVVKKISEQKPWTKNATVNKTCITMLLRSDFVWGCVHTIANSFSCHQQKRSGIVWTTTARDRHKPFTHVEHRCRMSGWPRWIGELNPVALKLLGWVVRS